MRHCGLYFNDKQVEQVRNKQNRDPLKEVWKLLRDTNKLEKLPSAQWNGLRYRLDDNTDAGVFTVSVIDDLLAESLDDIPYFNAITHTLTVAQCIELVRDHPTLTTAQDARWRDLLFDRVGEINKRDFEPSIAESLWLTALNMAAGVVLERQPLIDDAAGVYRRTIDEDIHPEGYLPRAIEATSGAQSLLNQLRSVQAMVLIAEMGRAIDLNLWGYNNRGVSVTTATTYPLYYYFYPEKWKWVEERYVGGKKVEAEVVHEDDAHAAFRSHAGFLEMINLYYGAKPLRAVRMILDDLRPVYDLHGGGLTTLTHGYVEKRGFLF